MLIDLYVVPTMKVHLTVLREILYQNQVLQRGDQLDAFDSTPFLVEDMQINNVALGHLMLDQHSNVYQPALYAAMNTTYNGIGMQLGSISEVSKDTWPLTLMQAPSAERNNAGLVKVRF